MNKKLKKTNPHITGLIDDLKTASREGGVDIWRDIAKRLTRPTRKYSEVNLSKLNRHTSADETVIIPGKVLGAGTIGHKITVAALDFSESAREKIIEQGGTCLHIEALVRENPSGTGVRIMQ